MKLSRYLSENDLTYDAFARRIGSKHARTVQRYAKGIQRPSGTMMAKVTAATKGEVTANDFFESSQDGHDAN